MPEIIHTLIAFALVLGISVFVHEFGHYAAARWRGIRIDTFSIGFGPALYQWVDRAGTRWQISAIPLGGYVKPHGFEVPGEVSEKEKASWIKGETFHEKSVGSRALVIAMGPIFNFMFAFVLFTLLFAFVGAPKISNRVLDVQPQSAAALAGIVPGDEITQIGALRVLSVDDIKAEASRHPGLKTTITVIRENATRQLPIVIGAKKADGDGPARGILGVAFRVDPAKPLPFGRAILASASKTWRVSADTLRGVVQILRGQRSARELGGTIRIAQISGQVASYGVASVISFMAILSINLGLINLFPIPILDGGRLVFYFIEALIRRPVPIKIQVVSFNVGLALIAGLFILSTVNDLANIGLFNWFGSG